MIFALAPTFFHLIEIKFAKYFFFLQIKKNDVEICQNVMRKSSLLLATDKSAPFLYRNDSFLYRNDPFDRRNDPFDHRIIPFEHRIIPFEYRSLPFEYRNNSFDHRSVPFKYRNNSFDHRNVPLRYMEHICSFRTYFSLLFLNSSSFIKKKTQKYMAICA